MKKIRFSTELAYLLGILILAFGTALMEKANLGMSMVVAPAYLFHLKISQTFAWFSFGMAEYCFQAVLIVVLSVLLRRFRISYLFSFVTAVIYGFVLDAGMAVAAMIPGEGIAARLLFYLAGMVLCALGVALLFHTYIPPEAYELFVKELVAVFGWETGKVKTAYDCSSCLLGIILSFIFFGFGHFEGVKLGTILCALVNGWIIATMCRIMEQTFEFSDSFPLRKKVGV